MSNNSINLIGSASSPSVLIEQESSQDNSGVRLTGNYTSVVDSSKYTIKSLLSESVSISRLVSIAGEDAKDVKAATDMLLKSINQQIEGLQNRLVRESDSVKENKLTFFSRLKYICIKLFGSNKCKEQHFQKLSKDLKSNLLTPQGKTFLGSFIRENQNNANVMNGLKKILGPESFSVMVIRNASNYSVHNTAVEFLNRKILEKDTTIIPLLQDLDTCDKEELQLALNRSNADQYVNELAQNDILFNASIGDDKKIEQLKEVQVVKDAARGYQFDIVLGEKTLEIRNIGSKEAIAKGILDQIKNLSNISNDEKIRLTDFLFKCSSQGLFVNQSYGSLIYHFEGDGKPTFNVNIDKEGGLRIKMSSEGRNNGGYSQIGLMAKFKPTINAEVEFTFNKGHSAKGKIDNIEVKKFEQTWENDSIELP